MRLKRQVHGFPQPGVRQIEIEAFLVAAEQQGGRAVEAVGAA
jgi:hypothetical protein